MPLSISPAATIVAARIARDQRGALRAQHVFGQAAAVGARAPVAFEFVGRVRERHGVAVVRQQRDVEILRVDQLADDRVHVAIEVRAGLVQARQRGDAVQRGLQAFAAFAFGDFAAQLAVGDLQLLRALDDVALQFDAAALAFQRGEDVLGDERQQRHLGRRVTTRAGVALHDHHAADVAIAQHRHAEPVGAVRAVQAQRAGDLLHQVGRGAHQRTLVAGEVPGQAAFDPRERDLFFRREDLVVDDVGEVEEAQRIAIAVVQRDVEVLRVHQVGDDAMQAAQHVRHLEVRAGHVGDRVQRTLQLLRLLQALDAFPHAAQVEGFAQARDRRGAQVDRGVRAVEHRDRAFAVVVEHARAGCRRSRPRGCGRRRRWRRR